MVWAAYILLFVLISLFVYLKYGTAMQVLREGILFCVVQEKFTYFCAYDRISS